MRGDKGMNPSGTHENVGNRPPMGADQAARTLILALTPCTITPLAEITGFLQVSSSFLVGEKVDR